MIENQQSVVLGFVGEKQVGKTCILKRYQFDEVPNHYTPTTAVQFSTGVYDCDDGSKIRLKIWDSSGQEKYKGMVGYHLQSAQGIFLIYDICDQQSFNQIVKWVKRIKNENNNDGELMLVGNKCDMKSERKVARNEGQRLAKSLGCSYWQASGITGQNVKQLFQEMIQAIITRRTAKRIQQRMNQQNLISEEAVCGNCITW